MSVTHTEPHSLERVRYFARQLMTAEDMRTEQDYFVERLRRHDRLLHGWGIVCGLQVLPAATAQKPWRVQVCPGFACSATGDDIAVDLGCFFDLAEPPDPAEGACVPCPCPPGPPLGDVGAGITTRWLAVRYLCRPARPVRTPAGCGCGDPDCDDGGCETSRLRDGFELGLLDTLPVPYDAASVQNEQQWLKKLGAEVRKRGLYGLTTPPCPGPAGPWVVLATAAGDLTKPPPEQGARDLSANLAACLKGNLRRLLPRAQDVLAALARP